MCWRFSSPGLDCLKQFSFFFLFLSNLRPIMFELLSIWNGINYSFSNPIQAEFCWRRNSTIHGDRNSMPSFLRFGHLLEILLQHQPNLLRTLQRTRNHKIPCETCFDIKKKLKLSVTKTEMKKTVMWWKTFG